MDWLPTLLAAAGTDADPGYPPDGMNLLPDLAQGAPIVPRKLFWRYKANCQRAMRVGDSKFLKILDNTFLFNVVDDPLERANLKDRQRDVYDDSWASGTLERDDAAGNSEKLSRRTGAEMADHIGLKPVPRDPDPDL